MSTIDLEDARWRAALDAELCCEATQSQRQLLVDYKPRGGEHRAEHALMSALGERPSEDGGQGAAYEGDESLLAAVMESFDAEAARSGSAANANAQPFAWRAVLLGAAAAVVTVGIGLLALGSRPDASQSATADHVAEQSVRPTSPTLAPAWNIASGSAVVTATGGVDAELPTDAVLHVQETLCTSNAGTSLCVEPGSQIRSEPSGSLALLEGAATLRTSQTVHAEHLLGLGPVTVEPSPHSVVVVQRQAAGWSVHVEGGEVRVLSSTTTTRVVHAGDTLAEGHMDPVDPAEPEVSEADMTDGTAAPTAALEDAEQPRGKSAASPRPKVSALLADARAQRRAGEMKKALRTYERLIARHPKSPAAQTARLSVGQLQLDAGNAKAALRSFRAYLRTPGALREDAAYGEIRALRRLGRSAAAQDATAKFKTRYPSSRYGKSLSAAVDD